MKTIIIYGSPKQKGTSTKITKRLTSRLFLKNKITEYYLNTMSYRGCQGCLGCKTKSDKCVLEDDLTPLLKQIENADNIIISSGVYFGDVTSQTKTFIDRLYSFYVPEFLTNPVITPLSRLKDGKRLIMILTQGHPDENFYSDIFPKYDYLLSRHGFKNNKLLRFTGISPLGSELTTNIKKKTDSFLI